MSSRVPTHLWNQANLENFKAQYCGTGKIPPEVDFEQYCEANGVDFDWVAVDENRNIISTLPETSNDPRKRLRVRDVTRLAGGAAGGYGHCLTEHGVFKGQ